MQLVVLLAVLLGIYSLILPGLRGRRGRPPRGVATRWSDPAAGDWPLGILGILAVDTFAPPAFFTGAGGFGFGIMLAVLLAVPAVRQITGTVLGIAGLAGAVIIFLGATVSGRYRWDWWGHPLLIALVVLFVTTSTAAFFRRGAAVRGHRGLALFALVEIAVFLASPLGIDPRELPASSQAGLFSLALLSAALLGWALSEFTLGIAAIGVAVTSTLMPALTGSAAAPVAALLGYMITHAILARVATTR